MSRGTEDYKAALINSLPQGPAFPKNGAPNRDAVLGAIAEELAEEDRLTDKLLSEANPQTTNDMLSDWEHDYGLPECDHQQGLTRQERLALLNEKITRVGSLNPQAVKKLCEDLGYTVEITERRPFVGGVSCGGDRVSGPHSCRCWWSVRVLEPRVTYFRGGVSTGGEKQVAIRRADDIECLLNNINHSQTRLNIGYEGN